MSEGQQKAQGSEWSERIETVGGGGQGEGRAQMAEGPDGAMGPLLISIALPVEGSCAHLLPCRANDLQWGIHTLPHPHPMASLGL